MNTQVPATAETSEQSREIVTAMPRRAPLVVGGGVQAIVPRDIEQAFRLATAITAADMAPKSYKRDANAVMVGILHGMEVGFTPMAALQSIAVINGMPSIWGDGALALIQASGLLEDMKEWTDNDKDGGLVAHCRMKRRGRAEWIEQQFSWKDAQVAKLTGKDTYQLYGRRMLQRRARAWAMTDGFADVLRGLHIREVMPGGELEEQDDGSYAPAPARPTRAAVIDADSGQAEAAAKAMDRQFAETMADEAAEQKPEATPAQPAAAAQAAAKPPVDHSATVAVILEKIEKIGTPKGLDNLVSVTFAEDIDVLRTDAPDAHAKVAEAIAAKRRWFAR